jgi:hypothetical protein
MLPDVDEFLERDDVCEEAKARVQETGQLGIANPTDAERLVAYQLMQARIIIELKIADGTAGQREDG